MTDPHHTAILSPSAGLGVAVVESIDRDRIGVRMGDSDSSTLIMCLLLTTSERPLQLALGDSVLVWQGPDPLVEAVVLGRIESSDRVAEDASVTPDELVLEAKQSLTLRVGDGSISIRADGRILIKGKDLVSHATRANRIKGGSVTIN